MKTVILAAVAVLTLGIGTAFAEGEGETLGALQWQAANGNPRIPGTEWFAMSPAERDALVHQLQQEAAAGVFPGLSQGGNAVAQGGGNPHS